MYTSGRCHPCMADSNHARLATARAKYIVRAAAGTFFIRQRPPLRDPSSSSISPPPPARRHMYMDDANGRDELEGRAALRPDIHMHLCTYIYLCMKGGKMLVCAWKGPRRSGRWWTGDGRAQGTFRCLFVGWCLAGRISLRRLQRLAVHHFWRPLLPIGGPSSHLGVLLGPRRALLVLRRVACLVLPCDRTRMVV